MTRSQSRATAAVLLIALTLGASPLPAAADSGVNTKEIPQQILQSGVDLKADALSPNTRQLSDLIGLTPLLKRIQDLRAKINPANFEPTPENLALSQQLNAATGELSLVLQRSTLAIDFALAEINAEENIYNELLATYNSDRDKRVLKTNAMSFIANGALWSVAEGFDIPTNRYPNLSIVSGATGVVAGIVPSVASMYALWQLRGKRRTSENQPNMLAKIFDYPTNPDIEYPRLVWAYLNAVPPDEKGGRTRRDMLIERWVDDQNIPDFTDRKSQKQLDVITASKSRRKGLSISTLTIRLVMLQQLGAEILKMKRMLLEIAMAATGDKVL